MVEEKKRMGFIKKLVLGVIALVVLVHVGAGVAAKITGNRDY